MLESLRGSFNYLGYANETGSITLELDQSEFAAGILTFLHDIREIERAELGKNDSAPKIGFGGGR